MRHLYRATTIILGLFFSSCAKNIVDRVHEIETPTAKLIHVPSDIKCQAFADGLFGNQHYVAAADDKDAIRYAFAWAASMGDTTEQKINCYFKRN